ncbi:6,7-dimethyl-8-ribityllumazine synthase [Pasteuria penetrans]|uniref:6,7-dimethyl-8-ribityllumazine synthase n=1 Tax=Pasteuria penetrans TaxID=86005 RepID=UPI000F91A406|nr:6,7-dimethyl-8-ribityllumazine synthase [Pasteuria penetrans]
MHMYEGKLQAEGLRLAAVVSRFHAPLTEQLLVGALDVWRRYGAREDDLTVVKVPGAFELPWAVDTLARRGEFDAIVALGIVVRGATSHYDWICRTTVEGLSRAGRENQVPILLGVLTVETLEQAWERSGTKHGNKGAEAAAAAVEVACLRRSLDSLVP